MFEQTVWHVEIVSNCVATLLIWQGLHAVELSSDNDLTERLAKLSSTTSDDEVEAAEVGMGSRNDSIIANGGVKESSSPPTKRLTWQQLSVYA